MRNILFTTDFTSSSQQALNWARFFAQKFGATLTLLHVYQPMLPDTTLPVLGDPGEGVTASHDIETLSQQRLVELATQLQAEGCAAQSDWRMGDVEEEILSAARDNGTDLIVVSRSGDHTIFDRLTGDTATTILKDSTCPLLLVPTTDNHHVVTPALVQNITYVMQPQTTQAEASRQTRALADGLGATLHFATPDQLDRKPADLIVVTDYRITGLFATNPAERVVSQSSVPVLVYHPEAK